MDYFDERENATLHFEYSGDYISAKFIEDTLNKEIARHKKCALTWEKDKNKKFRDYAKFEFEDVAILERIKEKLLGGKNGK